MNEVTLSCMICTYSDSDRSWKLTPSTSASGPIKYISTLLQLRGDSPTTDNKPIIPQTIWF